MIALADKPVPASCGHAGRVAGPDKDQRAIPFRYPFY